MKREQGYTLIEMMVAITLVIMLGSLGLYGWRAWQQRERLWQTAWQVRDYLFLLRDDANWHNRDHKLRVYRDGRGWCLLSSAAENLFCPAAGRFTFRPPWPEVELVEMTSSLGFYGLRNTAWAGRIRLRSAAGEWWLLVSDWGRIRLCERAADKACR